MNQHITCVWNLVFTNLIHEIKTNFILNDKIRKCDRNFSHGTNFYNPSLLN